MVRTAWAGEGEKAMRTWEEGSREGGWSFSVAASHWVCSAAGGTTNGQSVPSKGQLGRAMIPGFTQKTQFGHDRFQL